ncbi:SDR family NAD(P)-dependent oxidoreductase [Acidisoma silvae]|uniref:SDR family oxidoreductase n=1 Tax=Acidisoma silvae TaxID=2802396 RepID=A0A964E0J1_9PROT|nr:SDR family NAD(P)-dependent oxidoreductase [Acidisoma silvae]MCB8877217.1 SDR family oxidoreductase [Acidisoma silvae]
MTYTIDLTGRVALVTGGTRGIGLAAAQRLGEAGASIVITGRDEAAASAALAGFEASGIAARFQKLDVTSEAEIVQVIGAIAAETGIDILVNSAGVASHCNFTETDAAHWDYIMNTNLRGTYLCCREALRAMATRGKGGSIVNIGSISGIVSNVPQNQAVYNASKAAVHMLTKSLASEFADRHIRVNAIAPGYVRTDMTQGGLDNPEWSKIWLDMTPMRRPGEADEIAQATLFLASDASSYITGEVMTIDGGYTLR